MLDWLRQQLLTVARVPAEPEPPAGAPGSVRVFRAGRNYYKLRVLRWLIGQVSAVIGIMVSLWFLDRFEESVAYAHEVRALHARQPAAAATPAANPATVTADQPAAVADPAKPVAPKKTARADRDLIRMAEKWPHWILPLLHLLEYGAIALFILQLPFTFAAVRLEFELHWYIVTDRSLRIRTGLFRLSESTMSFANLQQVEIQQGPLQRLLKLSDVRVQSAGGGGEQKGHEADDSLHTGIFHGVENAPEIRDLILDRLRRFREAGLGDPDDRHHAPATPPPTSADTLAAAQELLAEARALRATLTS